MAQKNPCESWREDKKGSQEEANKYCKGKGLVYCGSKKEAEEAKKSVLRQSKIENTSEKSFDKYVRDYFKL